MTIDPPGRLASSVKSFAASWQRLALSVSLAVVCVAVLGTRVYVDFERVRVRLVTAPRPAEGVYGVPEGNGVKCAETIGTLDADPRVRPVVRAEWEGAPALLYEILR